VMSEESRRRFAALPAIQDPQVLASLVRTTAEQGLWAELLPLVELLPEECQRVVATQAAGLPKADLKELVARAETLGLGDRLAELLPAR
jgi:hypothetical protein